MGSTANVVDFEIFRVRFGKWLRSRAGERFSIGSGSAYTCSTCLIQDQGLSVSCTSAIAKGKGSVCACKTDRIESKVIA